LRGRPIRLGVQDLPQRGHRVLHLDGRACSELPCRYRPADVMPSDIRTDGSQRR
jgi:hypothetical protein